MADDSTSHRALDLLLSEGNVEDASLNEGDNEGLRPLHNAAKLGNRQTMELLLLNHANANLRDSASKLPRDYAAGEGHTQLVTLLDTHVQAMGGEEDQDIQPPSFLVNLNVRALNGELDPIVGRADEIAEVAEMLGKLKQNNPLLVGAAGVGKTAIVEGIADLIARGEAPPQLADKTIYMLDIGVLMAGTGGRGELEERVQEWLEFAAANPDILFFVDEIHLITTESTGGIAIANLLKPALARGTLRCIGATTDAEYRRHILSDKALNRRFMKVSVEEPSKEDALEIVLGARDRLAAHHGIKISYDAIVASVELASYFPEQKLPDISLSLLDEAASMLSFGRGRMQLAQLDIVDKIERRLGVMSSLSNTRKKEVKAERKQLEDERDTYDEKLAQHIDTKFTEVSAQIEALEAREDSDKELLSGLRGELRKLTNRRKLRARHIAELVSRKLKIPVEQILKEKQHDIANLEESLKERVFGQDQAIKSISDTLTISYAGLGGTGRTLGSFLLLGPTGTGKTHTAKMLAELLFGDERRHLLRFDMSEYGESHTMSSLLGAPPGYVGYDQGGKLVSDVLRTPHTVLLFDEIEKAHPEFQNILLQILDGARLTDRSNETVDFSNVIVVMTSNSKDYREHFLPEVLNRIDNILHYSKLDRQVMASLVQEQLHVLNADLQKREHKVVISLSENAIERLSDEGYDPDFGARPLHREFRRLVTLPVSKLVISGEIKGNFLLDLTDDGVELTPRKTRKN